jgi:hypothetical protein
MLHYLLITRSGINLISVDLTRSQIKRQDKAVSTAAVAIISAV